jgi:hypothetical protein
MYKAIKPCAMQELHCFYQLPAGSTDKYSYIVECVFCSNHNSGLVSYTE